MPSLILPPLYFRNYVVQAILDLEMPYANAILASQFQGKYVELSTQKFSSNVVERCFLHFGKDFPATIISEFLAVPHFGQFLQHPYANYPIQRALEYSKVVRNLSNKTRILPCSSFLTQAFSLSVTGSASNGTRESHSSFGSNPENQPSLQAGILQTAIKEVNRLLLICWCNYLQTKLDG